MKKFKVDVVRMSYSTKTYEVEALNEMNAKDLAIDLACNDVFYDKTADYTIEDIQEIE